MDYKNMPQNWPADAVVRKSIDELVPYARNARTHSDEQIEEIVASMREWGWTNPVLVDEQGMIIAGHGRVLAAKKLGLGEVPVMIAEGWTEAQKKAYVLADNQLAMNAGWNEELLGAELRELKDWDFDLSLTGFSNIDELMAKKTVGETDPEVVPTEPENPVSQLGDIWVLGRHRLICGDSTDPEAVKAVLDGATPHLMVTDPPYGVEYDPDWRNRAARTSPGMGNRAIGAGAIGQVRNDDRADWTEAWELFSGEVAYVWHSALFTGVVLESLIKTGFELRSQVIWDKGQLVIGRGHYHWQHEPCWYAVRKGKTGHWAGDRKQSTVWQIPKQRSSETGHSTQKPLECMARPIRNNSKAGQEVYEPFAGSGTTLIACETEGRTCYAVELNPAYCDVIVDRWQQFTKKAAQNITRPEVSIDIREG